MSLSPSVACRGAAEKPGLRQGSWCPKMSFDYISGAPHGIFTRSKKYEKLIEIYMLPSHTANVFAEISPLWKGPKERSRWLF